MTPANSLELFPQQCSVPSLGTKWPLWLMTTRFESMTPVNSQELFFHPVKSSTTIRLGGGSPHSKCPGIQRWMTCCSWDPWSVPGRLRRSGWGIKESRWSRRSRERIWEVFALWWRLIPPWMWSLGAIHQAGFLSSCKINTLFCCVTTFILHFVFLYCYLYFCTDMVLNKQ